MKLNKAVAGAAVLVLGLGLAACGSDDKTSVSFTSPKDGATVSNPVKIEMAAKGITIEPAGAIHKDAGHFHVLVDRDCIKKDLPIPTNTEGVNHYGKAQTSAELTLTPGEHTLCLEVGNGAHVAFDDTKTISITVK